jgi:hypothetical protein
LDVWSENIAGEEVPKFIYGFPVDGKLTAVLLVGAFVTKAADPWSCAGPGETCADGCSEVTMSTLLDSNCHARLGWGSVTLVKLIPAL